MAERNETSGRARQGRGASCRPTPAPANMGGLMPGATARTNIHALAPRCRPQQRAADIRSATQRRRIGSRHRPPGGARGRERLEMGSAMGKLPAPGGNRECALPRICLDDALTPGRRRRRAASQSTVRACIFYADELLPDPGGGLCVILPRQLPDLRHEHRDGLREG